MKYTISNTLKDLGITPNLLGYAYLRDAIELATDNPAVVHRITKELYPRIAKLNNTTPTRVERAMRNAIEGAWSAPGGTTRETIFRHAYSAKTGKPTNSEFIATVADYLQMTRGEKHGS